MVQGTVDYRGLDEPAVFRKPGAEPRRQAPEAKVAEDMDYLDIPAFLRKQAD